MGATGFSFLVRGKRSTPWPSGPRPRQRKDGVAVEVGRVWLELPSPIHSYKPNTSSIRKPSSTRIIIPSKANIYIYIY